MSHSTTHRPVRTFHGRSGRLGPTSTAAIADLSPRYGITLSDASLLGSVNDPRPVIVEIGSGMGEATAAMAAADPDTVIVATEVHTAGVAALLRRVDHDGLDNVRVMHADGVEVLRRMVEPASLAGVRMFFPDPWPKARHHKRRLVRPDLMALTAERIRPGGTLHAATDWGEYADQMLTVLAAQPLLRNEFDGFASRPSWRPVTRFEAKGMRQGHPIHDLLFRRV